MFYIATVKREGRYWLIEFPDAPGCQTFTEKKDQIEATAAEALESWLEAHLVSGRLPPEPKRRKASKDAVRIDVPLSIATAIEVRRARQRAGLTQGDLAEAAGVSQQAVAKLERNGSNPTIATLEKVARAVGGRLAVTIEA